VSCRLVGKCHVQEVASFFQAILETPFKTTRRHGKGKDKNILAVRFWIQSRGILKALDGESTYLSRIDSIRQYCLLSRFIE
jgi:hypothetical protein